MKKSIFIMFLVAIFFVSMSCSSENSTREPVENESENVIEVQDEPVSVRIQVMDWTEENPVSDKAEIWIKGMGSWYFKHEIEFGGTAKTIGEKDLNSVYKMHIYPDSRDGKEMMVEFKITEEMNPNGSPRDAISVNIYDAKVEVHGLPIGAANDGKTEFVFDI